MGNVGSEVTNGIVTSRINWVIEPKGENNDIITEIKFKDNGQFAFLWSCLSLGVDHTDRTVHHSLKLTRFSSDI